MSLWGKVGSFAGGLVGSAFGPVGAAVGAKLGGALGGAVGPRPRTTPQGSMGLTLPTVGGSFGGGGGDTVTQLFQHYFGRAPNATERQDALNTGGGSTMENAIAYWAGKGNANILPTLAGGVARAAGTITRAAGTIGGITSMFPRLSPGGSAGGCGCNGSSGRDPCTGQRTSSQPAPLATFFGGCCPPGRVLRRINNGRDICMKRPTMNVFNPRALARADKRLTGFARRGSAILKDLGFQVSRHRHVKIGKKRRRRGR